MNPTLLLLLILISHVKLSNSRSTIVSVYLFTRQTYENFTIWETIVNFLAGTYTNDTLFIGN